MTDTIVLTPTWEAVMPQLLAILANSKADPAARAYAYESVMTLARAADKVRRAAS